MGGVCSEAVAMQASASWLCTDELKEYTECAGGAAATAGDVWDLWSGDKAGGRRVAADVTGVGEV